MLVQTDPVEPALSYPLSPLIRSRWRYPWPTSQIAPETGIEFNEKVILNILRRLASPGALEFEAANRDSISSLQAGLFLKLT